MSRPTLRPTLRLLLSHPAHFLSLGLGSGLSPRAPGTVGTLLAWAIFVLIRPPFSDIGFGIFVLASFIVGCLFVPITGRALGVVDHGGIVWDEFVAIWLVLWLAPVGFWWQVACVVLFRVFDILKPWPVNIADKRFKNGFGVMFDDLLAAGYALLILQALKGTGIAWNYSQHCKCCDCSNAQGYGKKGRIFSFGHYRRSNVCRRCLLFPLSDLTHV